VGKARGTGAYERLVREAERPRRDHRTALMRAAAKGDVATLRDLLRGGARVDDTTPHEPESMFFEGGQTALMYAARCGHLEAAAVLLDAGASLVAVADDGDTPLASAACSGQIDIVELLLVRGAPWTPPGAKFTPLYHAAAQGDVAMAAMLLDRGAAIDEPIWTGTTPLAAAARAGAPPMVELLLRRGASVDHRDRRGRTALMEIAESDLGDVELLMRRDEAALARLSEVTRLLIEAGADVRARDAAGDAALDLAAGRYNDLLDVVRRLVEAGAEVDGRDAGGRTPLARACALHATLVAAYLLEAGADPDAADASGATPLSLATANRYADLIQLLAECGASTKKARGSARARRGGIEPPVGSVAAITRAAAHFGRGEYAAALAAYRWLPAPLRERVPGIASNMGYCLQQAGDQAEAVRHFRLALARDPSLTHAARAACFSCSEQQAWREMLPFAQQAVRGSPRDSYAWQQLAIAHFGLDQHRKAVTAGRKAVAIDPRNAYAACNLALAEHALGDAAWVPTLRRALELAPALADVDDVAKLLADPAYRARAPRRKLARPAREKPAPGKKPAPRAKPASRTRRAPRRRS
jgi:ankyrin repeat protein/Tfp pilus assembly protein PilF